MFSSSPGLAQPDRSHGHPLARWHQNTKGEADASPFSSIRDPAGQFAPPAQVQDAILIRRGSALACFGMVILSTP